MELKLIGQILRRWSWLLVIGILIGGGIGYAISIYQTPEYLASTKILVMEPLGDNASNVNNLNDKELAETYMQLLTTQPILESVSQKVGVTVRKTQIKATRVRDTGLLEVTVRDTDPQRAALTANVLVEVLIEYNEALQKSRFSSSEQSLELQVSEIEGELGRLESNVEQRSEQTLEEQQLAVDQKKTELEQQIFGLQGEIARLEQDIDDLTPEALPNQLAPPLTLEQRNQLNEKRTQLAQKQFQLELAQETYFRLMLPAGASAATVQDPTNLQNLEQANLELYRQLYSTLLSNYEAVRLARLQNTPNVVQVEKALPPTIPIQAGPLRNIILARSSGCC